MARPRSPYAHLVAVKTNTSHPILSMWSVCGLHQVCPSALLLAYKAFTLKFSSQHKVSQDRKKWRLIFPQASPFTSNNPVSPPGVNLGHFRVSWPTIWDSWMHAVWWRELESWCRTHLSLFLLFCPIFLLLESGRVCKSHSLWPRLYVCTAAVVTVALFNVLQLMCSYLCVCLCPNVHGRPVRAWKSLYWFN